MTLTAHHTILLSIAALPPKLLCWNCAVRLIVCPLQVAGRRLTQHQGLFSLQALSPIVSAGCKGIAE